MNRVLAASGLVCLAVFQTVISFSSSVDAANENKRAMDIFKCTRLDNAWTTTMETRMGTKQFIRWVDDSMIHYPPERRCKEATPRMNQAFNSGQSLLTYGKWGNYNGQVICTTNKLRGQCETLILTLLPSVDPKLVLADLTKLSDSSIAPESSLPSRQCTSLRGLGHIYINMQKFRNGDKYFAKSSCP